jgi:hypothetical protein
MLNRQGGRRDSLSDSRIQTVCSLSEEAVWLCLLQCAKTPELRMHALCRSDIAGDRSCKSSDGIHTGRILTKVTYGSNGKV